MQAVFRTQRSRNYLSSGSGAWEASLVNTLSPGDRVVVFETGHFAAQWATLASNPGFSVDLIAGDWRHGADAAAIGDDARRPALLMA